MKKTLLAIALAAATMPLTFAQTTPAPAQNPPAKTTTKKAEKAAKKHVKKAKKAPTTAAAPKTNK